MTARTFYSVRFNQAMWEKLHPNGFLVFIFYNIDGKERWTASSVMHGSIELARMEVEAIKEDGIIDAEFGPVTPENITNIEIRQRQDS